MKFLVSFLAFHQSQRKRSLDVIHRYEQSCIYQTLKCVNHTLKSWDVSDAALRKLKKYCKRLTGIYIVSTVFTKKKLQWEEIKDDESGVELNLLNDSNLDMVETCVRPTLVGYF